MVKEEPTSEIIRCAIDVHRILGPGLLESAYRECLEYELVNNGFYVVKEKPMPIVYKEIHLDHGYRMDLLVDNRIVLELKTVEFLTDVHFAQLLTYLRLGDYPLGLLINFNVKLLKDGIKRVINT
jgi:GxxExxY protein